MASLKIKLPKRGVTRNIERNITTTSNCNFCSCCKCNSTTPFSCEAIPAALMGRLTLDPGCPTVSLFGAASACLSPLTPFGWSLPEFSPNHWGGSSACHTATCSVGINLGMVCSGNTLTISFVFSIGQHAGAGPSGTYCDCGSVGPQLFTLDGPTLIAAGSLIMSPFSLNLGTVSLCGNGSCNANLTITI